MSTEFGKIFNESTILKKLTIKINDDEVFEEDIVSLQLNWRFKTFPVDGELVIKDTYDMSALDAFDGNTTVEVYAVDPYDTIFKRTFVVYNTSNQQYGGRFKSITLNLVDEFYYNTQKIYVSKGFANKSETEAFKIYLQENKITINGSEVTLEKYLENEKIALNLEDDGTKESFVIPQNKTFIDHMWERYNNEGFRFYQTRDAINVKKVNFNELEVIQVEGKDIDFSNATSNDKYGFKIYDFRQAANNRLKSNTAKPTSLHAAFNYDTKSMDYSTHNLDTVYSTMAMNSKDLSNLQQTIGTKLITDFAPNLDKQKMALEDAFMDDNKLEIVVPGNFKYNQIGMLATVTLKGNVMVTQSTLEGDVVNSGKYFISEIKDKYIGDKMIQKITLNRVDANEPRKQA